jgi:hypothetical protein
MTHLEALREAFKAAPQDAQDGLFLRVSGDRFRRGDPATVARLHALWRKLNPAEMKTFVTEFF